MSMKKTKIMFERFLNDTEPPKKVIRGGLMRLPKHIMLYGVWLRRYKPEEFEKRYQEWKKESN